MEIGRFRKNDFEELEKWADEVGISTDELSEQILRMAGRYLSLRRASQASGENVVPFGPVG
jgi:hypothetical protein